MSELKIWQISSLILGLFCLTILVIRMGGLLTTVQAQKIEKQSVALTSIPYRRYVNFQIPNGSAGTIGGIPDVPANKKLTIEFASIRVFLPSASVRANAGLNSGGSFNAFNLSDQGNFGGFEQFVAAQPLNLIYESGNLNSGIYVNRSNTTGVANVSVYIVGELEQ